MIAAWMLYALLVSVLAAAAAWLLEGAVRMRGGPVRFVWMGALLGTVALAALAPLRTAPPAANGAPGITILDVPASTAKVQATPVEQALATIRAVLALPLRAAAALDAGTTGTALAAAWALLSATLLGIVVVTALRVRRARRAWPRAEMAGHAVRVAPGTGPAVLGIVRPDIVVPAWLLNATADEQRLVVLHEREHVRARDPLLLAAGCVAAALLPWSPAAWWMLLRLRAAVELDCDGRVLRGGVPRRAYGSLLIDMAGRGPELSLGTPALAGSPSTLERRLRAMNGRLPRFARTRAGLFGALGLALIAGACETPLPTTAEVQRMDVATLEAKTLQLQPADGQDVTYFVDDRQVTAEEAHALVGDRIVRMDVTRGSPTGGSVVQIHTKDGAAGQDGRLRTPAPGVETLEVRAGNQGPIGVRTPGGTDPAARFTGLLVIDGVISEQSALNALDPDAIQTVDVIKGAAAAALYDDPRAADGVIRVTTKAAAGNH